MITASLPCYSKANVDLQRGLGVFEKSIRGLKRLNALGYGKANSGLILNLVYNPTGPFLPPAQATLEQTYRDELKSAHGIEFSALLTLANMPIARFRHDLSRQGALEPYMALLVDSFSAVNLADVMCRHLLSVDWRGHVYDCDFNQMLGLPLGGSQTSVHLSALLDWPSRGSAIAVADHCYGCTAGQGSSCGGALTRTE
jgi:radical SAM/Cys-rich protein